MNILFLHSSPDLYGAGKVALEDIKILIKNGHNVVICMSREGPLCDILRDIGCSVNIIPLATVRREYFNLRGILNRFYVYRKSLKALKRVANEHKIELIYTNTTGILTGAIFAKKTRLKHLWHVHEITPGPRWLLKFYGHLLSKYSDVVIAVSDAVKDHWLKVNERINIVRVYNGFDLDAYDGTSWLKKEFNIKSDTILIGMVARVHFWKGQTYFLDIAAQLKSRHSNLKFIMVGDAFPGYEYLYEEIRTRINSHQLEEDVIDLGYREDITRILYDLDIFILPSIQPDPLPTTIIEAMSSGKPVIATNHGGAPEMLKEGETGFLIPWNNAIEAANKIDSLIIDTGLREKMGKAGELRVKNIFSLKRHEQEIIKLINAI
ncbi:MAG: glycosyltransferase family 4 protein [Roseivirga sp.]|jgi:glycosyltransferase involved in cell wall biosynthesis|uniref:glycosyltransferase family 4 protein n=1 Tax=Roseivirga sp. TaxID=1964215 RepID=UPI001B222D8B|nr:glycosyltransferase family 4 protein [Roseivirga sp.]MBO6497575.1 glycosyltransferase family 4 protein [Roseivirga sp.]